MVNNNSVNTNFTVTGTNHALTQPKQPCFAAKLSNTTLTNVTGSGSNYTVLFDTVTFDNLTNYATGTGAFTAPVTGRYFFTAGVLLSSIGAGHTIANMYIYISTGTLFTVCDSINAATVAVSGNLTLTGSNIIPLTSGQTVVIIVNVGGSTASVGVQGTAGNASWFHGFLMD